MSVKVQKQVTVIVSGNDVHRLSLLCKLVACPDARARLTADQEYAAKEFAREMNSREDIWGANPETGDK